ncbi:tyrosine-type recombinase/integrase [uncultured Clostridium sp.]|uniref:tyrosine-type recombinase/integrase n=1 Tax=uncultured Clostridium sp. TaxID=59620 RepID=UPI002617E425|nr:tyrosine-type recombinase/integrase [uncultured Clostridium sp.]
MSIDSIIIRVVGKYTDNFEEQLKLKSILEEVLNEYQITELSTSLIASDMMEHIREFILTKKFEGLSDKSLRNYSYELVRLSKYIIKPVNLITKVDLTLYFANFNIAKTTLSTRITITKNFFTWLFENDKITDNPTKKIKKPRIDKKLREGLTKEELEIVKEACINIRERVVIEFLASTGCRVGELEFLRVRDIDFNTNQVKVTGKGNKQRIVIFNYKTKILLIKYFKERGFESEYVFCTTIKPYKNLGIRRLEEIVSAIGKRVNNRVYPHKLRHTFCTHKVDGGMSMPVVQQLMGHESLGTTERYFTLSKSTIENEYNKLSN